MDKVIIISIIYSIVVNSQKEIEHDCLAPIKDILPNIEGMYRENRQRVINDMQSNIGPMLIVGGQEDSRAYSDNEIDFRNESPFLWLSGWNKPGSVLTFGMNGLTFLFVPRKSRSSAIFDGDWDFNEIKENFDVDDVFYTDEIIFQLKTHFPEIPRLNVFDVDRLLKKFPEVATKFSLDQSIFRSAIRQQRMFKSEAEIEMLRVSATIAATAHRELMKFVRPGWLENEAHALFELESYNCGERFQSYTPIIASGKNGAILHYNANDALILDGDMMLIDAAGEYFGFASDITRSWPANGIFNEKQRKIYEIVLNAQAAAINLVQNGQLFSTVCNVSRNIILEGLIEQDFLRGNLQEMISANVTATFMPHRLSHGVGFDVHDDTDKTILLPNYVLTIEPGIYFIQLLIDKAKLSNHAYLYNFELIDLYRDFGGVRIEDVVVVQKTGPPIILSDFAPRGISEIEALMASNDDHDDEGIKLQMYLKQTAKISEKLATVRRMKSSVSA